MKTLNLYEEEIYLDSLAGYEEEDLDSFCISSSINEHNYDIDFVVNWGSFDLDADSSYAAILLWDFKKLKSRRK